MSDVDPPRLLDGNLDADVARVLRSSAEDDVSSAQVTQLQARVIAAAGVAAIATAKATATASVVSAGAKVAQATAWTAPVAAATAATGGAVATGSAIATTAKVVIAVGLIASSTQLPRLVSDELAGAHSAHRSSAQSEPLRPKLEQRQLPARALEHARELPLVLDVPVPSQTVELEAPVASRVADVVDARPTNVTASSAAPVPVEATESTPPATTIDESLGAEASLITTMQSASPSEVISLAALHGARFTHPRLEPERDLLVLEALATLGDARAACTLAARMLNASHAEAYRERVQSIAKKLRECGAQIDIAQE